MKRTFNLTKFTEGLVKHCALTTVKKFKKNEVITTYLLKRNQICILLSGEAYQIRYTASGERRIVYSFKKGDAFGEAFYRLHSNRELFVLAKKDCEVLFLPYDKLDSCSKDCTFHLQLLRDLPDLFLNRISEINQRTEMLARKGIRDKLLGYFRSLNIESSNKMIEIPFSLTDLADYLVLDRSAMMREIAKMKDEGIIEKEGRKIIVLQDSEL